MKLIESMESVQSRWRPETCGLSGPIMKLVHEILDLGKRQSATVAGMLRTKGHIPLESAHKHLRAKVTAAKLVAGGHPDGEGRVWSENLSQTVSMAAVISEA